MRKIFRKNFHWFRTVCIRIWKHETCQLPGYELLNFGSKENIRETRICCGSKRSRVLSFEIKLLCYHGCVLGVLYAASLGYAFSGFCVFTDPQLFVQIMLASTIYFVWCNKHSRFNRDVAYFFWMTANKEKPVIYRGNPYEFMEGRIENSFAPHNLMSGYL